MPTPQEFESQISSGISLVHFHNSDGSNKIFDKLATQYHNVPDVKIFNVDCGQEDLKGLCENEEVKFSKKNVPKTNDFFCRLKNIQRSFCTKMATVAQTIKKIQL